MTATPPPLPTAPPRENPHRLWLTIFSAVFAALLIQFVLFLVCFNVERSVEKAIQSDRYRANQEERDFNKLLKRTGGGR